MTATCACLAGYHLPTTSAVVHTSPCKHLISRTLHAAVAYSTMRVTHAANTGPVCYTALHIPANTLRTPASISR